ncbi:Transferrin receptor-like dimerization domain-containing protein 1 [Elsinoe fawcettii]|nr:Transferrin receptor-like dimerization domain-containing protein 1 [Elsinoe fawcettii]
MPSNHDYISLPIPTYEEAISSSRPGSSNLGASEISADAERQGLLPSSSDGYRAPTVESARSSLDSDLSFHEMHSDGGGDEAELVRRDMEEMEVLDPDTPGRSSFSKRLSYFTHTLSTLRLPRLNLRERGWSCPTPRLPEGAISVPIVARIIGLIFIGLMVYSLFALNVIPNRAGMGQHYDPESVRHRVQEEVDKGRIAEYLRYITSFDHVAGTEGDWFLAQWVHEKWNAAGLDKVDYLEYFVYLNYPTPNGRRVSIVEPEELRWDAKLEEENVFRTTGQARQQTMTWHGGSRAGNVTGHLVYANGGTREDFKRLEEMGVQVKGSVVLVRHYAGQDDAGLKVKAAELAGAVGCLIYSDPKEDGFVKGKAIPEGQWRPADSVQRDSVGLLSWVLGDALTPGWASVAKAERKSENDNPGLVSIPSLPLGWRDAERLLQGIQGQGKEVPEEWRGAVPEVKEWWTGTIEGPKVLLLNQQDENKQQQIWNVRGIIQGLEAPEKRIMVGNHRDAWCFGAVDPGSGTAVLMEVVNIFGTLRKYGWRPLRTIEFFSWDAEEYNMIGSTEYVEEHARFLRDHTVSYVNVDAGVSGPDFRASASPLYGRVLKHVLDRVGDPVSNKSIQTIWNDRGAKIDSLEYEGDYVPFQNLAGASSLDFGFTGPKHGFPAHSCYETFEWMQQFGDSDFDYHKALAQIWALIILELADRPIIPFDLNEYANAVVGYVDQLDRDTSHMKTNVGKLKEAADLLKKNAGDFHKFEDFWIAQVMGRGGFETNAFAIQRLQHNDRLQAFESDLLDLPGMLEGDEKDQHGIPGREQYKHIIFGPPAWSGSGQSHFPAVRDAIEANDAKAVQLHVDKAARIIERAAQRLVREE